MEGLCRAAMSCKAGIVVGALRIACNGLCTAARFHTEENPGCLLECHEGSIAFGITIDVSPFLNPYIPCGLAPANAFHIRASSMTFCSNLPSEAIGYAFSLLGSSMRLSRLITCRETIVALVSLSKNLCMEELK